MSWNWDWTTTDKELQERDAHRMTVGGRAGKPVHQTVPTHPQFVYSNLPFVATTTQTAALSANSNRVFLMVQNQGTVNIYVSAGAPQGAILIAPNGAITLDIMAPNNDIYIFTLTGSSQCAVMQGMRAM